MARQTVQLQAKYKSFNPGEFAGFDGEELKHVLTKEMSVAVDDGTGNKKVRKMKLASAARNLEVIKAFTREERFKLLNGEAKHLNRDYEPGDRIVALENHAQALIKAGMCEPLEEVTARKTVKDADGTVIFERDKRRSLRATEAKKLEEQGTVRRQLAE